MSSSPNPVRKKRQTGRPKPFKVMTRTLIFLGFIFYSLLSFSYFFKPESLSHWTKFYFCIYPFIFLAYVYTFKMDCKKGRKKCLSASIFNILFLTLLFTVMFFIYGILMNPGLEKNKLHLAITVFSMGAIMLFDFFIFEYMQGIFKPKARKTRSSRKNTVKAAPRRPADNPQTSNTSSGSNSTIYTPQSLENTIEFIYGSQQASCRPDSSNIASSKEML